MPTLADLLPPLAGIASGPLQEGNGFVRRDYQRGNVAVDVTLAQRPMSQDQYDAWVRASNDYPQARTGLPPDAANGFLSCADNGAASPCDLHVQFRAGYHLEIMGGGHSTRTDLQDLLARLPIGQIANSRQR